MHAILPFRATMWSPLCPESPAIHVLGGLFFCGFGALARPAILPTQGVGSDRMEEESAGGTRLVL